ncbi:hypothetical protein V2A60_003725 [Cordyceps javanica]
MTDAEVEAGLALARAARRGDGLRQAVQRARRRPAPRGLRAWASAPWSAFPHGSSTTSVKDLRGGGGASATGAREIDMVVNVGQGVRRAVARTWSTRLTTSTAWCGAAARCSRSFFENDYLQEAHIVRLCELCTCLGVAAPTGWYWYDGVTAAHLRLMRAAAGSDVQVKAAGGVRTFDDVLRAVTLDATRIGATATAAIVEEATARGVTAEAEADIQVKW